MASPNTDVYTALQFQRANQKHRRGGEVEGRVNTKKKVFTKREEKEERKKVPPYTLDNYFVKANVKWDAASNPLPSLSK
jgi:hypothetical protein